MIEIIYYDFFEIFTSFLVMKVTNLQLNNMFTLYNRI